MGLFGFGSKKKSKGSKLNYRKTVKSNKSTPVRGKVDVVKRWNGVKTVSFDSVKKSSYYDKKNYYFKIDCKGNFLIGTYGGKGKLVFNHSQVLYIVDAFCSFYPGRFNEELSAILFGRLSKKYKLGLIKQKCDSKNKTKVHFLVFKVNEKSGFEYKIPDGKIVNYFDTFTPKEMIKITQEITKIKKDKKMMQKIQKINEIKTQKNVYNLKKK